MKGGAVYGPLKLMEEILAEVKTECFHKLEAVIMAPFPPNADDTQGLIRLDMLKEMKNDFEFNGSDYSINEMNAAYAFLLQPNAQNQPFDVFISYKWGEPQKTIVRFLYSRLGRTLIQREDNRALRVYLDEKKNREGDNFAFKFCSAFKGLKIFLPLVNDEALQRMEKHDPSTVDYVLAEWLIALSTGCRILPILLGPKDENDDNRWKKLDLKELKKNLPDMYPNETVSFVKEQLEKVGMMECVQTISKISKWTVKNVVERFFHNLCLDWESNASLIKSRERILDILMEVRSSQTANPT